MKIIKLPQAFIDLIETADYIARDDPAIANRFFNDFDSTLEILAKMPKIGTARQLSDGRIIRMWFVQGFERCLIFYTENSEEIVVLRIIHSSRDYTRLFEVK
jgi:plasmid stabilization system protein ParE